jgi:hypothetical protein
MIEQIESFIEQRYDVEVSDAFFPSINSVMMTKEKMLVPKNKKK